MVEQGRYLLGTAMEIAEFLTKAVVAESDSLSAQEAKASFKDCDFTIFVGDPDEAEAEGLEAAVYEMEAWYGIKQINTGFGSDDCNLFADYYSGGCPFSQTLYDGMDFWEVKEVIYSLIENTLNMVESCDKQTMLFAELVEKEK